MSNSFTVLVDTREKNPWELNSSRVLGREMVKLETGDYSLPGLEDKLCIDRKANVNELAGNIHQERFKRELYRIKEIPHAFLILEASAQDVLDYPNNADLPPAIRKKIRVNGNYLMRCILPDRDWETNTS